MNIKIKSKLFKIWSKPAKLSSIEVGSAVLSLEETRPGGTRGMGALVICVTRGMEGKLAFVELLPGTAFYGSQVLLTNSDSGLIPPIIGSLLGSPHAHLYTHVSLHATPWPLQVTIENQTCNSHETRWMSDCPKHENSQYKTGLDWSSMTSMLKKTARTKQKAIS
jgi:hypothetical protein